MRLLNLLILIVIFIAQLLHVYDLIRGDHKTEIRFSECPF